MQYYKGNFCENERQIESCLSQAYGFKNISKEISLKMKALIKEKVDVEKRRQKLLNQIETLREN